MHPNSKDQVMKSQVSQTSSDQFNYHTETKESTTPTEDTKSCHQSSKFILRRKVSKAHKSVDSAGRVKNVSDEHCKILELSTMLDSEEMYKRRFVRH